MSDILTGFGFKAKMLLVQNLQARTVPFRTGMLQTRSTLNSEHVISIRMIVLVSHMIVITADY